MPAGRPVLDDVLSAPRPRDVDGVIQLMRAIVAALPRADGVAAFTRLYLAVTEGVRDGLEKGRYRDETFVARLDVVFANLFFAALRDHARDPARAPRAWRPLIEARRGRGIAPLQFALAGMNAHINRDLPVALVDTWRALGTEPRRGGAQHRDFTRINRLLEETEARVKVEFARGLVGELDRALGRLDDVVAIWNVTRAREAAWVNGETLWALRHVPPLRARFLLALDRMVGFGGRGLLRPIAI